MADEAPKVTLERSASHRVIHSNFYRYRIGMGDFSILFGTIMEESPGTPNSVVEEVTIAMSWQQTKLLSKTLAAAVSIIEQEAGEFAVPLGSPEATAAEHAQLVNNLRSMFGTASLKTGAED